MSVPAPPPSPSVPGHSVLQQRGFHSCGDQQAEGVSLMWFWVRGGGAPRAQRLGVQVHPSYWDL